MTGGHGSSCKSGKICFAILGPLRRSAYLCFQITKQPLELFAVRIVIFPLAEISDVPRPAYVGGPRLWCIHHGVVDANWKEHCPILAVFALTGGVHFAFNPTALHGRVRKNDHHFVEKPNRIFDAFLEAVANLQIFRREPAAKVLRQKEVTASKNKLLKRSGSHYL